MQKAEFRMQNEAHMKYNAIVEKSFDFSCRIVYLYKHMVQEQKEYVLSRQILRSGTSIGANVHEAQRGQSRADFAAKMNIALKEANETEYWLRLLYKTEYLSEQQFSSMHHDIDELISILVAICTTAGAAK